MPRAVIVFSFPEPDSAVVLAKIIEKAKSVFEDNPEMRVGMAINDAAQTVLSVFNPEMRGE